MPRRRIGGDIVSRLVSGIQGFIRNPITLLVVVGALVVVVVHYENPTASKFKSFIEAKTKTTNSPQLKKFLEWVVDNEPKVAAFLCFVPAILRAPSSQRYGVALIVGLWALYGPTASIIQYAAQGLILFLYFMPTLASDKFVIVGLGILLYCGGFLHGEVTTTTPTG